MNPLLNKSSIGILQQGLSIAKWINRFNPESINTNDLMLPKQLHEFHDSVNEALDEIEKSIAPNYLKGPKISSYSCLDL